MKLIFAGTPEFAEQALTSLVAAGHEIGLVLTQPDRPAGRGKKLRASAVKQTAQASGIPVFQPNGLRNDPDAWQTIRDVGADVMVVAAYGLILPKEVLEIPRLGCINIHASLLPRWRGAAPIQRAIEAGDQQTGITIMQMDEGLDTGAMLLTVLTAIESSDTGASLHDRLARLGGTAIVDALDRLPQLDPVQQSEPAATYAKRLVRDDARLDWNLSATDLVNRVRAFDPVPGNGCRLASDPAVSIKIWLIESQSPFDPQSPHDTRQPGTVVHADEAQVHVACADSLVRVLQIQRAGGRRMDIADFQRGGAIQAGDRFIN